MSTIDIAEAVLEEMEQENPRMAEKARALGLEAHVQPLGPLLVLALSPIRFVVGSRVVMVSLNYGIFTVSLLTLYRGSENKPRKPGRSISAHSANRAVTAAAQMIFTAVRTQ
jgi:hypothetical protein